MERTHEALEFFEKTMNEYNERVGENDFGEFCINHYACNFAALTTEVEYLGESFSAASGVSKGVLWFDDSDFNDIVFKMPFSGLYYDYCDREADFYQAAKKDNVEEFFAETVYLGEAKIEYKGDIYELPIYAQERVDMDADDIDNALYSSFIKNYTEDVRNRYDEDSEDYNEAMGEEAIMDAYWSEDSTSIALGLFDNGALSEFVWREGINDLHEGNIGRRADGSLVMVDYSGYEG